MTDHYIVACKISNFEASRKHITAPLYRDKRQFNNDAYNEDLFGKLEKLVHFNFPLNCKNFDSVFDQFVEIMAETINKHAPQKRISRKQAKLALEPWITKGILTSIRKKTPCLKRILLKEALYKNCFFANIVINLPKSKLYRNKCIFTQN